MAYEVVKRVGSRAYRYRVESYRDPKTGKSKGNWTYLGRYVEPAGDSRSANRRVRISTSDRLIAAFQSLLEESSFDKVTVATIASRAGVSHATFYRNFPNKGSVLVAALMRMKNELNPAAVLHLTSDVAGERAKLRGFLQRLLTRGVNSGLVRAVFEARFSDARVRAFWEQLIKERALIWRTYIGEINAAGLGRGDDPKKLTDTLMVFAQGMLSELALRGRAVAETEIDVLAEIFGRIVFR